MKHHNSINQNQFLLQKLTHFLCAIKRVKHVYTFDLGSHCHMNLYYILNKTKA